MSVETFLSALEKVKRNVSGRWHRPIGSIAYLNECFTLLENGSLVWKDRPASHFNGWYGYKGWNKKYAGKIADVDSGNGYSLVCINGVRYKSHRIVFAIANGIDPGEMQIDHKNGDKKDNRKDNLRLATQSQNSINFKGNRSDSKNKYPRGVSWNKSNKKYEANVCVNGIHKYLGLFDSLEEAASCASKARNEHFGEFWNGS